MEFIATLNNTDFRHLASSPSQLPRDENVKGTQLGALSLSELDK